MMIGILALQGSFKEHADVLKKLGVDVLEVRTVADADKVDGLIIPGGESTAFMKLLTQSGLDTWIQTAARKNLPIYGTCAGMIVLSQSHLKVADVEVERNAYGRQQESFEAEVDFMGKKIPAVFIRAPKIAKLDSSWKILATHESTPILAQKENILIGAFHPELTNDLSVHRYFVGMVDKNKK